MSDRMRPAEGERPEPSAATDDEFASFLSDIASTVSEVMDEAPWRRRLAGAILRWEGEGLRTRRLERALESEAAIDPEPVVAGFERDAARLLELAAELRALGAPNAGVPLDDPDRLAEVERHLATARTARPPEPAAPTSRPVAGEPPTAGPERGAAAAKPGSAGDRWFANAEKLAWDWVALDERVVEELG
jgi:hypothetical protein